MLNNQVTKAVRLALALGAVSASAVTVAEEADTQEVERIEITGSAIKRTDLEGALPVDVIDAADIAKSGVTSVPDLIANIPSMQGFTAAGESVGGGGGGIQTASLRDLGAEYTLVLINGRRMASSDSGSSIDINSIPLAAIKRVEILKDGASALYGSDAIAGVVNFILKDDVTDFTVAARYDKPKDTSSSNFSFTGGFGDLSSDGFNVMVSFSRDEQDNLRSVDRDFAKTGFVEFEHAGQNLIAIAGSSNAIPGNAYVSYKEVDASGNYNLDKDGNQIIKTYALNPYKEANGSCHTTSAPAGNACQFDYTSTLEIQPESERNNLFLQGTFAVNDETEAYVTASASKFEMTTRIAPYPTGGFVLNRNLGEESSFVNDNVIKYLPTEYIDANGIKQDVLNERTGSVTARWRVLPGGNRTDEWSTTTNHIVAGVRGDFGEWNYDFAITSSGAEREQNRITGYPLEEEFMALVTSGEVDIFADPASLTPEQNDAVRATMFSGNWETTDTDLFAVDGKVSGPIAELDAGTVYMAAGWDYRKSSYSLTNGKGQNDEVVLFESAGTEFDLERDSYGAFVEVVVPVLENLEVTGSLRYDEIGEITDSKRTGNQTVNQSVDDTTYKLSVSYRPTDALLLRASYGTGFKAATMRQIAAPRLEFGVTASAYDCPEGLRQEIAQFCHTEKLQYDVFREGNADLQPETSKQYTYGFVWSGDQGMSFGVDYWNVKMENQVTRLTQNQIFGDPVTYAEWFTTKFDKGSEKTVVAIIQAADNVGESRNSGIDWHFDFTTEFSFGTLKSQLTGTYMIESESLRVGSDNIWDTSLGQVGTNEAVTFRNIVNFNNTFTHGDFTHSLNIKARSGYTDAPASASFYVAQADDWDKAVDGSVIQKHVPVYMTFDYRLAYAWGDNANIGFGIKNLFDKEPPFTLNAAAGHQVGYDPRYADAYGRSFYLQADYTF
ncbi:TonB-denpendent receptor [Pseudoalteromonas luteoviolacea CPMOR-2]|uniref:TonB-denpendent receptor n=1 Tax=Pseudoalteromonas luteoviolacea DSM 6061 TaxID=1365250 RepID=A0A161XWP3_9GAMM|nr:TonB-dependent receptor [Pseudoalteromonas luteoviolacea]KZN37677.1 TonB-denpendent receptor [Pseudoalteromonas luteoviolacea DSM 6061]KZN60732.1 TonB-denpendent receptor [Pseudoalteromonas luteoviolacea CPMOR-2]MBE0386897.1 iron complex outermembrane recepter protein [Pseudoalteromonas luteoviolacea DSM 6061]